MNYPNHMKAWSDADKTRLVDFFIMDYSWEDIADVLGRTVNGIKSKLYQMHNNPRSEYEVELSNRLEEYIINYESTGKYAGRLVDSNVEEKEESESIYSKQLKVLLGREFFMDTDPRVKTLLTVKSAIITENGNIYVSASKATEYTTFFPLEDCDFVEETVHLD